MTENKQLKNVISWLKSQQIIESQEDLAEKLGYNPISLSHIVTGKKPISSKFAKKLVDFCKKINYNYLFGDNEMLKHEADTNDNSRYYGIPLIPIEAIAGFPTDDFEGVILEDCEIYRIPEFEKIGAKFLIRVSGNSMYPKYSNGDLLAIKKLEDVLFFQWGKVYVIDSSQGPLVKRIFEDENPDYIRLVSDNNEKYPPFSIPKSDIRSLSIVLGVVRLE